ncbi:MAG: hypothetical protein HY258_04290 [Chloroflexi bacterium]|nr:hypothetical protein [Chloroflexota bacterium]
MQKASAILAGQSGTLLAQRLLPPAKPIPPTQPKLPMRRTQIISSIVASSILGLLALWVIFGTKFDVLTLCSGVALIIVAIIPTLREVWLQEKRKTEYNNWRQAVQGQDKAVKVWNLILQSWNQLYYCARDDCVFVLGAKTFAPSSIMTEYLHKLQDNEIKKELAIKSQEPLIQDNRQVDEEKSFWTWAVLVAILLVCLALSVWLAISLK